MTAYHKLVTFDRPLAGAIIPGRSRRQFSETEIEEIRVKAYREGSDSAEAFANQQMVELRADVQALQDGLFSKLTDSENAIVAQLQAALPGLVVEMAQRLLGGFEPPVELVEKLCRQTLEQLYPERENLELLVSTRDAELLEQLNPSWKSRYPGLRVTADSTLSAGDCQVRSRFGITDARLSAKLDTLSRELLSR